MNNVIQDKKLPLLDLLFIFYYAYLAINPKMNVQFSLLNFVVIEIIYAIYVYMVDNSLRRIIKTLFFGAVIIALLLTFATEIVTVDANAEDREVKSLISMFHLFFSMCFPLLMSYRLINNGTQKQRLIAMLFVFSVFFVIIQVTWVELQINARILKSQMEANIDGDNALIGGYHFVCASPILVSALFYSAMRSKQKMVRFCLYGLSAFFVVFLSKSMYSIALLSGVLGIATCFYSQSGHRYKTLYLAAPFIVWFLAPMLLTFVISILDEGDTKLRMTELYNFFTTGDLGDDDLAARFDLYGKSILAFVTSPIWGNFHLGFNPHSTAFELLARIGLLGFIPFYMMLKGSFSLMHKTLSSWSVLPCLSSFVLMCLTNPVHASLPLNISLWFMAPLLYNFIDNFNKKI